MVDHTQAPKAEKAEKQIASMAEGQITQEKKPMTKYFFKFFILNFFNF